MGNAEKSALNVAIVLFDMEVHPTETPTNSKGQCHLVIFTTGHLFVVCQYVQKTSFLKTTGSFLNIFHMQISG